MVHPEVLESCGIDSTKYYSGWAFGMGLERLAMRRFQIADLRLILRTTSASWSSFKKGECYDVTVKKMAE
ncbi:MAG: hypothetical protein ACLSCQ_12865 [Evtepia gabavorous]